MGIDEKVLSECDISWRNILKNRKMIFITLGSQKFQFNRLLKSVDDLVENGQITEPVFAQIGYSDYTPRFYEFTQFLDRDEFLRYEKNADIDLVITHHPNGYGFVNFYDVIEMQAEKNALHNVPINVSEALTNKRLNEVSRSVYGANHYRDVETAKLLKLNYMCMHTVADNFVESFLTEKMKLEKPNTLSDIIDILYTIEEYKISAKRYNPPKIFNGSNKSKVGNIIVDMTGGASFDSAMIDALSKAGISTIIVMNISDRLLDECKKHYINVVCAGHMSSDSLGLNLLFKAIKEKTKEDFEILPASGYIFVSK